MSEILSEDDLEIIRELSIKMVVPALVRKKIGQLIASHRQLQQRVTDLEEELAVTKPAALNFIDLSAHIRRERDALKHELEHWTFESFKKRETDLVRQIAEFRKEAP